jgi:hypothetical protein
VAVILPLMYYPLCTTPYVLHMMNNLLEWVVVEKYQVFVVLDELLKS